LQAWSVEEWGLENLALHTVDRASPGPGQVQVRFRSASLNYRDLLVVEGQYNPKFSRPLVPCSDGFGEIVAVGAGVKEEFVGRSVLTLFCPDWAGGEPTAESLRTTLGGPMDGVLTPFRNFYPSQLLFLDEPSALTPGEWSTLPCAGVTAWNCLMDLAGLQPGQSVLLIGTGGVSLFGLQIAKMVGARILLLSSDPEKRERARELGADATEDYRRNPKWSEWVREQTGGEGVDVVLETGGAGTLPQSLKAVRLGGIISLVGVLSGTRGDINILPLVMKAVNVRGAVVGNKAHSKALVKAYLQNMVRPVVHRSYEWTDVPAAFQELQSGAQFGKITINFPDPDQDSPSPA